MLTDRSSLQMEMAEISALRLASIEEAGPCKSSMGGLSDSRPEGFFYGLRIRTAILVFRL